jgi:hypothetical protein
MEQAFIEFEPGNDEQSDIVPPVKEKKRPGRPKKQIQRKTIPKEGIVNFPSNKNMETSCPNFVNVLEVIYGNPTMFKKIFHLLKVMAAQTVRIKFDSRGIKMYATDHLEKNKIYIKIFGERINRYYCEDVIEIGCDPTRINEKLATLTKDHGKIIIATNRQYQRSKITMILANDEMQEDGVDNIEIDEIDNYDWSIEESLQKENNYPIQFELPSKYFKKKISDFSRGCDILRIEKTGKEHLRFTYNHRDKRGRHDSYFKNPVIINLVSFLEEDDIFSTSVYLEHIKPFAAALIADEIHIAADKEDDLIFTAYLDQDEKVIPGSQKKYKVANTERCVIKVITEIVKSKRDTSN